MRINCRKDGAQVIFQISSQLDAGYRIARFELAGLFGAGRIPTGNELGPK